MKTILSIAGLVGLLAVFALTMFHEKDKRSNLQENGLRTIGTVYDKFKPAKGGRRLKYYFFIRDTRYNGISTRDLQYPTEINDKRVVVYDPLDPTSSKLLVHEEIIDSADLKKYLGTPIIFNPD